MHADADGKLTPDNHDDCESFYVDSKRRSVFFERYFDTCDDDDYIIEVSLLWIRVFIKEHFESISKTL